MKSNFGAQIDSASELFESLKSLKRNISGVGEGLELGLLQQYLDEGSLYVKQIPRVSNNIQILNK